MTGLKTANQSETRHSAIERGLFMVMTRAGPVFFRRIDVSTEEIDDQCHGEDGDRVHGRFAVADASVRRSFLCA